jgi:hypothetical protein
LFIVLFIGAVHHERYDDDNTRVVMMIILIKTTPNGLVYYSGKTFLHSTASRTALESTQPSVPWILGALSAMVK